MGGTTKRVSTTPEEITPLRNSIVDALMSGNVGPNLGNNPYNQSWMNAQRMGSANSGMGPRTGNNWLDNVGGGAVRQMLVGSRPQGASADFLDMLNSGIFAQGPNLDSFADPNGALFTSIRGGYDDMFNQNRALALAQAKEASGNLTGSGYAANLGGVVNRSLGEQNGLLSQVLTQLAMGQYQQENANAQNNASRFIQMLMSMAGGGVGPMEVVQSGGIGAILAPIAQGFGQKLGGSIPTGG